MICLTPFTSLLVSKYIDRSSTMPSSNRSLPQLRISTMQYHLAMHSRFWRRKQLLGRFQTISSPITMYKAFLACLVRYHVQAIFIGHAVHVFSRHVEDEYHALSIMLCHRLAKEIERSESWCEQLAPALAPLSNQDLPHPPYSTSHQPPPWQRKRRGSAIRFIRCSFLYLPANHGWFDRTRRWPKTCTSL